MTKIIHLLTYCRLYDSLCTYLSDLRWTGYPTKVEDFSPEVLEHRAQNTLEIIIERSQFLHKSFPKKFELREKSACKKIRKVFKIYALFIYDVSRTFWAREPYGIDETKIYFKIRGSKTHLRPDHDEFRWPWNNFGLNTFPSFFSWEKIYFFLVENFSYFFEKYCFYEKPKSHCLLETKQ